MAATNDTSARPFPFKLKEKLAQLAGVPAGKFYQVKSPFRADEITKSYDPADTQLIFVTQPIGAQAPNDAAFIDLLKTLAIFLTGSLGGVLASNGL